MDTSLRVFQFGLESRKLHGSICSFLTKNKSNTNDKILFLCMYVYMCIVYLLKKKNRFYHENAENSNREPCIHKF